MLDESEYVKVCDYEVNRAIIAKCTEEDREITTKDILNPVHELLDSYGIEYQNKLVEHWNEQNMAKYILFVEVYVLKKDFEKAKELINELYPNKTKNEETDSDKKFKKVAHTLGSIYLIILVCMGLLLVYVLILGIKYLFS